MKKAVFHLDELHIGPKAERGRKGRKLRDVVLRKPEAEKDEPEFFVSFWVYSDMGKLDRDASRLDIRFGLDELRRNSIKTVLNRMFFAVPGAVSYYRVYACFRRLEEGKEEPVQEIQSVRDFDFLPEIDADDLRKLPASYYAGIPAGIFPEGSMKSLAAMGEALPFGDLMCGYVLRSMGDLSTFPIALRFNIGETKWFRGFTPTRVLAWLKDSLALFFKGGAAILINHSTPKPVFLPQTGDKTEFPKIGFTPKDSLNDIYNMVFRPDEVSGAEGADWFSRGWKTDFVEPAKVREAGIANRVALAAVVYHMQQARKRGLDNFRVQWIFTTYAPYVVRVKYSTLVTGVPIPIPGDDIFKHLPENTAWDKTIYKLNELDNTINVIELLEDPSKIDRETGKPLHPRMLKILKEMITPEVKLFVDIMTNPRDHTEHVQRDEVYVLWKPVHITGESMAEYIREKRGSMPSADTSITIAEMLSDFYTIRRIEISHERRIDTRGRKGINIDYTPQTILWGGEHLAFASFRSTNIPQKMSTVYSRMRFPHAEEELSEHIGGFTFGDDRDNPTGMLTRRRSLLPRLLLDIDFTRGEGPRTKTQLLGQEEAIYYLGYNVDVSESDLSEYPELGHREEMSFREYVRLQNEFARVTTDLMPDNLLFADQEDPVMRTQFNDAAARDRFYTGWKEGTALTPVTTPLPSLL